VIDLDENKNAVITAEEENVITVKTRGTTFTIVEHFSNEQTYLDIVKNAIRREFGYSSNP